MAPAVGASDLKYGPQPEPHPAAFRDRGSYTRTTLWQALGKVPTDIGGAVRDVRALFSQDKQRTFLREQIDRDHLLLRQRVLSLIGQLSDLVEIQLLGAEEAFRALRRFINFGPFKIMNSCLHGSRYLDFQLCDSEIEAHRGYLQLDDYWVQVLTLKELPSETRPLLLKDLFEIGTNFHVVTEWRAIDNARARKQIASRRRHHHNTKTSFLFNLEDKGNSGPNDDLVDDSKRAAVEELGECLKAIGNDGKYFGEFTLSAVLYDRHEDRVREAIPEFQKVFTTHDALLYEERYNLLNAFFATVPGNHAFNLRQQEMLNTNYADLSFLFTIDQGRQWNDHLNSEYLAVLETDHFTPYYVNLHDQDVAHTLILGYTGSGKSFLLNFLIQNLQKYEPLTYIFDLGGSYESLTQIFDGSYLNVGLESQAFTINPFCLEPTRENVSRWMKRAPRDPEPARRWLAFLRNHREVIAAMDFFTVPTITFNLLYCFFIIGHDRRRIVHSNVTRHPTSTWIVQQLREAFPYESAPKFLTYDHDRKYGLEVVAAVRCVGITSAQTSIQSPWQNGVAERWVGSCRRELLDHTIALDERHLKRLLSEYVRYYHEDRTHLGLRKETPSGRTRAGSSGRVMSFPRVGGLHHRYDRAAA